MAKVNSDLIRQITWDKVAKNKKFPKFQTGDTVGVYVKVKEGEKERVQLYSGVVLKVQGSGAGRSFTVRKIASGVGVERTFPLLSPIIDRIELISRGKVRRARLFYLRGLKGRSARLDTAIYFGEGGAAAAPGAADEVAEPEAPIDPAVAAAAAEAKAKKKAAKAAKKEAGAKKK
jgi:large subunit ribosomal protein L19